MDIENSLQNALDRFIGFLPNLIGFLVLLVIGWIVARLVRTAVRKGLAMTGIDDHMQRSRAHGYVERALPGASVSHAVALVAFWFVLVFFAVAAVTALDIPELTRFMNDVLAYLPNVLVAIAISSSRPSSPAVSPLLSPGRWVTRPRGGSSRRWLLPS